jgi:hypothetical protein
MNFMTLTEFMRYNNISNSDEFLDIEGEKLPRQTEEQAKDIVKKETGCDTVSSFQALPKEIRKEHLRKLRSQGISIRQLSRLTGESRGVIQRL